MKLTRAQDATKNRPSRRGSVGVSTSIDIFPYLLGRKKALARDFAVGFIFYLQISCRLTLLMHSARRVIFGTRLQVN